MGLSIKSGKRSKLQPPKSGDLIEIGLSAFVVLTENIVVSPYSGTLFLKIIVCTYVFFNVYYNFGRFFVTLQKLVKICKVYKRNQEVMS